MDVFFDEYMADEIGTLERVYDCAGMALDRPGPGRDRGLPARPIPEGRRGRVVYDLRRHFDVTPEEVRSRFGAYLDRFPVRIEV